MDINIEQLLAERKQIIENYKDNDYDRLVEINNALNEHHEYRGKFYRGFSEYSECTASLVGDSFKKQIKKGERFNGFLCSWYYLNDNDLSKLIPVENYDINNIEHRQKNACKNVITFSFNPSPVEYDCLRIDIIGDLNFHYYDEKSDRLQSVSVSVYVRNGYRWSQDGVNFSCMGTVNSGFANIYADLIKIGVTIHESIKQTALEIKGTKPTA